MIKVCWLRGPVTMKKCVADELCRREGRSLLEDVLVLWKLSRAGNVFAATCAI